jgi:hypothetical protein
MTTKFTNQIRDLILEEVSKPDFKSIDVAYGISLGIDRAMLNRKSARDDVGMDRIVEIHEYLEQWEQRDTWEPAEGDE